jgi:UDP-glucose 4-epimerase
MRILVLGGTRFVGRAIVEELVAAGHQVAVMHRGRTTPKDWVTVEHILGDRSELLELSDRLAGFSPDVAVDTFALSRNDAQMGSEALSRRLPMVVLSSMDVYAVYLGVHCGEPVQAVPFDETADLRSQRYPYREQEGRFIDYDKLDVEEVYLRRGATICRLPIIFGPHDTQRREDFVLARIRAGRRRIPFGAGNWLASRIHVADVARAVRAVVEHGDLPGEIFNIGPSQTSTVRQWADEIIAAASVDAELVSVPEHLLPSDLAISGTYAQHLLADSSKARRVLGWREVDQSMRVIDSVTWHLSHPPVVGRTDFSDDDRALALAGTARDW